MSDVHTSRVIAGHKATLKNPNTSEGAKAHSRQIIADLTGAHDEQQNSHGSTTADDIHDHRVAGGYKATLHNPRTSDVAKQHAREMLQSEQIQEEAHRPHQSHSPEEQHEHRVLGGYRATISNPNTSEEAKQHAREYLAAHDHSD